MEPQFTAFIGASAMFVFTVFWTCLTLLLTSDAYSLSTEQIGLVSLFAIVGAFSAQGVGRAFDRGLATPIIGLVTTIVALAIAALGRNVLGVVIVAVVVFFVGVQGVLVLSQTRMMSLDPAAHSQMNTVFVVTGFIAGAVGSAVAGHIWALGGWIALMVTGGIVALLALGVWCPERADVRGGRQERVITSTR